MPLDIILGNSYVTLLWIVGKMLEQLMKSGVQLWITLWNVWITAKDYVKFCAYN